MERLSMSFFISATYGCEMTPATGNSSALWEGWNVTRVTSLKRFAVFTLVVSCLCCTRVWSIDFTPVRRTTIVTADLEASLAFYRDLLGFTIEWDVTSTEVGSVAFFPAGTEEGRAVALRQGPLLGGSIGLVWAPGVKPPASPCAMPAPAGSVALLMLTDDLPGLRARLEKAGVKTVAPKVSYENSRGPTEAFAVYDPNCIRVTFAYKRDETLEQTMSK
jgi:catechol 2,3-dioxygenase-like lactoylglutathione lyase family enzyme